MFISRDLPSSCVGTQLTVSYSSEKDERYLELEELGEFMKELSFQAEEKKMTGQFLFWVFSESTDQEIITITVYNFHMVFILSIWTLGYQQGI